MSVSIRPAVIEDLQRVAEMNARLIADEGSRNPMTLTELHERARSWLDDPSATLTIALQDENVIGCVVTKAITRLRYVVSETPVDKSWRWHEP